MVLVPSQYNEKPGIMERTYLQSPFPKDIEMSVKFQRQKVTVADAVENVKPEDLQWLAASLGGYGSVH